MSHMSGENPIQWRGEGLGTPGEGLEIRDRMSDPKTGSFAFADGSRYVGEYIEEGGVRLRHGTGRFDDGMESYDGAWVKDEMSGSGTYCSASGAVYEGEFKSNRYDGTGKYRWKDGSGYEGGWKEGKMHGQGSYTDQDGVVWSGQFYNGKFFNGKAYLSLRP